MKIGKLPESVLVRSILKQVKHRRDEVLVGPGVGQDCAALQLKEGEVFVMSTDPITGTTKDLGSHSIHITANDLAASGAEPVGVMLTAMLPDTVEEPEIRRLMQDIERTCEQLGMEVLGGHTEITNVVLQPLISVTGVGKIRREELLSTMQMKPHQDIVISKWIGLEATTILAKEKDEELRRVFSEDFISTAKGFDAFLSVVEDARIAKKCQVSAMHDITEGGVFGALWEMAEGAGVGLEVDLKKIPIRQETVEICEFFGVNPYLIMSSGSMMIAADDGLLVVQELKKAGIEATVIGRTTAGNDRILRNGDDVRYLDRPQTDELYKVLG
ncbi:AIR synthase family protein [Ruminococcus gauvreauii]|uniref:AIR synthase family protein n=1 Tax=Ruminococcus gauvreauii TaxID=438033 RepID=A0ABY5VJ99_9FIRM|nr:AIR synthase family protein [Ruminococcus gauvreauii]UWP60387.1 AIR synthase family protein [Ruminococcus gauvreauii]